MKLRDRKTGEAIELKLIQTNCECLIEHEIDTIYGKEISLKTLDEYCEDYEPLIKDEKIRKAVRAWAEADGADKKIYLTIDDNGSRFANKYGGYIEFAFQIDMEEGLYTIAELCGEEEE